MDDGGELLPDCNAERNKTMPCPNKSEEVSDSMKPNQQRLGRTKSTLFLPRGTDFQ